MASRVRGKGNVRNTRQEKLKNWKTENHRQNQKKKQYSRGLGIGALPRELRVWKYCFFCVFFLFFRCFFVFSKGPPSPKSLSILFFCFFWFVHGVYHFFDANYSQKNWTLFPCKIKQNHCKYQWIARKYRFWEVVPCTVYIYIYT